jgi:hypothetical protein
VPEPGSFVGFPFFLYATRQNCAKCRNSRGRPRAGPTGSRSGRTNETARRRPYSTRSLVLASSVVCHCMLLGASVPPRLSGTT